jgi:hypothetical protein
LQQNAKKNLTQQLWTFHFENGYSAYATFVTVHLYTSNQSILKTRQCAEWGTPKKENADVL